MIRETYKFFDKLEDKIRAVLSRRPVIYTLIGAFAIVLFWRGVWGSADLLSVWFGISPLWSNILSIVVSVAVLLATGLFVSFFIGERILISGLKQEKKIFDKTEYELKTEGEEFGEIEARLEHIDKELEELKNKK